GQGVRRRDAGEVGQLHLPRLRRRRLHVPLRHQAGADAHRQRHVRGDRGRAEEPAPKADRNYVLVASEWYLDSDGLKQPAQFSMEKAHARTPDWMTFNGYAGQYVTHALTAKPGETVRFWVLDAGASIDTDFHVVGTILN